MALIEWLHVMLCHSLPQTLLATSTAKKSKKKKKKVSDGEGGKVCS